jgi:hypothetical protein
MARSAKLRIRTLRHLLERHLRLLTYRFFFDIFRQRLQGPITEEIVFRGCILSVYHLASVSMKRMIFLSPLSFGAGANSTFTPNIVSLIFYPFHSSHPSRVGHIQPIW